MEYKYVPEIHEEAKRAAIIKFKRGYIGAKNNAMKWGVTSLFVLVSFSGIYASISGSISGDYWETREHVISYIIIIALSSLCGYIDANQKDSIFEDEIRRREMELLRRNKFRAPKPTPQKSPAVQPAIQITQNKQDIPEKKPPAENQDIIEICKSLIASSKPTFILGKAGTGKTTLIGTLRKLSHFKNHVVLAPTGVAALNAYGQTIHSFFHLPPRIIAPDDLKLSRTPKAWRKVEYIFIDEISMVRCDVLDLIDARLRSVRNPDLPFGGAKVVMFGDFFQLPPVCPPAENEILEKMGYSSVFAFSAKSLAEFGYETFELEKVYRQTQLEFISSLNALRKNDKTPDAISYFNRTCLGAHRSGVKPVTLMGSNAEVNAFNRKKLFEIESGLIEFEAIFEGEFNLTNDRLPAPELLELKKGARVIALKNDVLKRWINGSLGTVKDIKKDSVLVDFDRGTTEWVKFSEWENIKYKWSEKDQKPISEVIGRFSQVPLNLAWALTIHKAQGKTLSDVRIELDNAFASGQAYVALSRATEIQGLSLGKKLSANDVFTDKIVEDFYSSILVKRLDVNHHISSQ